MTWSLSNFECDDPKPLFPDSGITPSDIRGTLAVQGMEPELAVNGQGKHLKFCMLYPAPTIEFPIDATMLPPSLTCSLCLTPSLHVWVFIMWTEFSVVNLPWWTHLFDCRRLYDLPEGCFLRNREIGKFTPIYQAAPVCTTVHVREENGSGVNTNWTRWTVFRGYCGLLDPFSEVSLLCPHHT